MKSFISKIVPTALIGIALATIAPDAQARPDKADECAIWICLPAAFAFGECDDAFDAMIWRVTRFKPPVPNFLGCIQGPEQNQTNASSTYSTSHYPDCNTSAGYTQTYINQRRGDDEKICRNPSTGQNYSIRESDDTYYNVRLTVDGETYTYSFNADNPGTNTPPSPTNDDRDEPFFDPTDTR